MILFPCFEMRNERATFMLDLRRNNRRLIVTTHDGNTREYKLSARRQERYTAAAYSILMRQGKWLVNADEVLNREYQPRAEGQELW